MSASDTEIFGQHNRVVQTTFPTEELTRPPLSTKKQDICVDSMRQKLKEGYRIEDLTNLERDIDFRIRYF
jgi:hypothetical protein